MPTRRFLPGEAGHQGVRTTGRLSLLMRIDIFETTTYGESRVFAVERQSGRCWDITTAQDGVGISILETIDVGNLGDLPYPTCELPEGVGKNVDDPDAIWMLEHSNQGIKIVGNIHGTKTDDLFLSAACEMCADEGWVVQATVLWYSPSDEHHYHLCWADLELKGVSPKHGAYSELA